MQSLSQYKLSAHLYRVAIFMRVPLQSNSVALGAVCARAQPPAHDHERKLRCACEEK